MAQNDMGASWSRVGDELSSLGLKLKLHAEQEFSKDDDAEVSSALHRLGESLDDAIDAMENAAEDEAVRDDLLKIRDELVDAMAATINRAKTQFRARRTTATA